MTRIEIMSVGLYARVSSEQQAKDNTIASQLEALDRRIEEDGHTCDHARRFIDEGYSGTTLIRPALERLRDLAAAGGLDRVYVHSPDRLARKYAYQVLLIDELRRHGVELVFLNRQIGTSPEEDLLLQVQGMVAEYERAKILERSRRGKRHAGASGSVNVLGGAPYGYRYVDKREGAGQASYQVIFEQARVVRQIFEWIGQERLSIGEVCRRLAREGIPSPRGKSYWDRSTVWGILKNPAYRGTAGFGKTRVGEMRARLRPHRNQAEQPRRARSTYDVPVEEWTTIPVPAIVSGELCGAVAEQLAENRVRRRQRRTGELHLLQGLLVCGSCGHAFYGKPVSLSSGKGKRRNYAYYRCIGTDAYRFGGQRICQNQQVRTDVLETAVWDDVRLLLSEPERIEQEYQRRVNTHKSQCPSSSSDLSAMIQRVQRGIARLIDAYEDGLVERTEFEPRIQGHQENAWPRSCRKQGTGQHEAQAGEQRLAIGQLRAFAINSGGLQHTDWEPSRRVIFAPWSWGRDQ